MFPVRYIHAADLHLDAAFLGISREASGAEISAQLRQATFTALDRLFALCEREKPDFLVIAGDIYNKEDRSIKAQLALRDGCERLSACGVQVFLAHGNHDPLSSRMQNLHWPSNTVIFTDTVSSHIVTREGAPVAVVHGISHAGPQETRNLAQSFRRHDMHGYDDDARRCFQLGVLHCTLDGMKADRYAPCTLADLNETGLDAWALGHIHQRTVCQPSPFVAYSGNIPGLHIHEEGPRGCYIVSAKPDTADATAETCPFTCDAEFQPLGPVQWQIVTADIDGVNKLDSVEDAIRSAMQDALAACDASCSTLICRVRLTGRSALDGTLRDARGVNELTERLRTTAYGQPLLWLKDIRVETGQEINMAEMLERKDLLGETLRLAQDMQQPDALAPFSAAALKQLYGNARASKALEPLTPEEQQQLMDEAQRLCVDMKEAN